MYTCYIMVGQKMEKIQSAKYRIKKMLFNESLTLNTVVENIMVQHCFVSNKTNLLFSLKRRTSVKPMIHLFAIFISKWEIGKYPTLHNFKLFLKWNINSIRHIKSCPNSPWNYSHMPSLKLIPKVVFTYDKTTQASESNPLCVLINLILHPQSKTNVTKKGFPLFIMLTNGQEKVISEWNYSN